VLFAVYPYVSVSVNPQNYFGLLQSAYNSAASGAVINAQGIAFTENLSCNLPIEVTIAGGWNAAFTTQSGSTAINGSLVISQGKVVANHLVVR
jgi:hypothetical protein